MTHNLGQSTEKKRLEDLLHLYTEPPHCTLSSQSLEITMGEKTYRMQELKMVNGYKETVFWTQQGSSVYELT